MNGRLAAGAIAAIGGALLLGTLARPRARAGTGRGAQRLVEGVSMHYEERGSGPAVVLIHGLGGSTFTWRGAMDLLEAEFHCIAIDLPPFGYSSRDATIGLSQSDSARRIEALLTELGVERAIVAGHSMGGAVAQRLAANHPETVEALVLVASMNAFESERFERGRGRARRLLPSLEAALRLTIPGRFAIGWGLRSMVHDDSVVTRELVDGYREPLLLPGTRVAMLKMFDDVIDEGALTGDIGAPTIVVSGAEDTVIRVGTGERLASRIRDAEHRVIGEGAHMLPDEYPGAIAQAIRDAHALAPG